MMDLDEKDVALLDDFKDAVEVSKQGHESLKLDDTWSRIRALHYQGLMMVQYLDSSKDDSRLFLVQATLAGRQAARGWRSRRAAARRRQRERYIAEALF